ncbi:MAG: hypothetical protein LBT64_02335 [Puniceicoccales bacterium]|jgi:hypothetical protein|nr:hypothetical protein [Puniceicoccales bacterium]
MKRIAEDLNFKIAADSPFYGTFGWLGNLLGKYSLSGDLRGKRMEIYSTRFPHFRQFPLRLVVKMNADFEKQFQITIRAKPLFAPLHSIFERNIFFTKDPILSKRLLLSSDSGDILAAILSYDEICDQLCEVWKSRRSPGVLVANGGSIFYHEPFGIIGKATRERIKNAANLMCDIFDVLSLLRNNWACGELAWNCCN